MPTKATPKKKSSGRVQTGAGRWVPVKYETVGMAELKLFPGNARKGNVPLIVGSLLEHGQVEPIKVQKSTKYTLGGNHTLKAMRYIQANPKTANDGKPLTAEQRERCANILAGKCDIVVLDVDDQEALEIVLVLNRSNDQAGYNSEALASLMKRVKNARAAGFSPQDLANLTNAATAGARDAAASAADMAESAASMIRNGTLADPVEDDDDVIDYASMDPDELDAAMEQAEAQDTKGKSKMAKGALESASEDLNGPVQLNDDVFFPSSHPLDIPEIRKDMLVETLPEPLLTWAGLPTRNWPDPDVWWFFNHGSERTEGMNDVSRMIQAFYAHDEYIDAWWYNLSKYAAKALNSKITMAVSPNYTIGGMPKALSLFQLYKGRYIARFLQEIGIRIIPDLNWILGDMDFFDRYILPGIPKNAPYLCRDLQSTFGATEDQTEEERFEQSLDELAVILDKLTPENLIVYCRSSDFEKVRTYGLNVNLIHQKTRMEMFGDLMPKKQKRTTL